MSTPKYFATPAKFRAWLEANHLKKSELLVGFYKTSSGKPSLTWPQSVDQALCFGWIDGVRRSIDGERYSIRFTPRKPTSIWSNINIAKVAALTKAGVMRPAGLEAFAAKSKTKQGVYSFERAEPAKLEPAQEQQFRADPKAWEYFEHQAPWYRRAALHWVTSAKREETRVKRLAQLISDSQQGQRIGPLSAYKRG